MAPPENMEQDPPPVLDYEEDVIQTDLLDQAVPETLYQLRCTYPPMRTQEETHAWLEALIDALKLPTEGLSYRWWDPPYSMESAESDQIAVDAYQQGAFVAVRQGRPGVTESNWVRTVRVNEGDSLDGAYPVDGRNYALQDAADYCDGLLEALRPHVPALAVCRLRTIVIAEIPASENHVYCFRYELMENGLPVDEADVIGRTYNFFFRPSYLEITLSVPDSFNAIALMYPYAVQERLPLEEGILTATEALETAEDTLARYSGYQVRNMELRYCCESATGQEELIYSPYWCLRIAGDDSEPPSLAGCPDPRTTVYINAVTGQVHLVDLLSRGGGT